MIINLTAGGSIFSPEEPVDSLPRNDNRRDGSDPLPKRGNYKLHFVKLCKFQDFQKSVL